MVRLSHAETVEGLKQAIYGRIQALANVHALFVQSRWTGAELRSLINDELSPYSRGGASTRLEGPSVSLTQDAAQTIAVAMHELATNAAKYGAPRATRVMSTLHGRERKMGCWPFIGQRAVGRPFTPLLMEALARV
jgi:two-component sensor histidine kinase